MNEDVKTANVAGIIFRLEMEAHKKLCMYIESFRERFGLSSEIAVDLEYRVAEILSEKYHGSNDIIKLDSINELVSIIGTVEQIEVENDTDNEKEDLPKRRLLRNIDDYVIAGVASGFAAYFNLSTRLMRIIFALSCFLGFGIFLYLVFWLILPIESVEGFGYDASEKKFSLKDFKERLKNLKYDDSLIGIKSSVQTNFSKMKKPMKGLTGAVAKLTGIGIIFSTIFLSLVVYIIVFSDTGFLPLSGDRMPYTLVEFNSVFFRSSVESKLVVFGVLTFMIIPVISLLWIGFKMIYNMKSNIVRMILTLVVVWIASFVICIVMGVKVGREFLSSASISEEYKFNNQQSNDLLITVNEDDVFSNHIRYDKINCFELLKVRKEDYVLGYPTISFVKSTEITKYEVDVIKSSNGLTEQDAIQKSEHIQYGIDDKKGVLELSPYFSITKNKSWRCQNVSIIVKVPEGKSISLDKSLKRIMPDYDQKVTPKGIVKL